MSPKRKGELTPAMILREHPFRVVFPDSEVNHDHMRGAGFYRSSAERKVSRCLDGAREVLVCFAERTDAVAFQRHAGGILEG
ncbi:hypothetical protein [Ancylobacter radicis]|uniref:Uncharacterized protein n=1 Tax=Ancylobacter radicis TaxID=2836179 RepID=A0ABS5RBF7_9HYPH|nr:hypothetical protein [Ancylobacter radicis]MBS9478986.1 hypothetical protein [Ancylobacter radicis]